MAAGRVAKEGHADLLHDPSRGVVSAGVVSSYDSGEIEPLERLLPRRKRPLCGETLPSNFGLQPPTDLDILLIKFDGVGVT